MRQERLHYQTNVSGDMIVTWGLRAHPIADAISIESAERLLRDFRKIAWTSAEQGLSIRAETYLEYVNELAEALEDAAAQRAKFGKIAA